MKVFVDTNVLVDVLSQREPFYQDSQRIWALVESGQIAGAVSAISFPTLAYLLEKLVDTRTTHSMLAIVRDIFSIVECDSKIVNLSIDSGFEDFEDAIQYHSALRISADCIITRDISGFRQATLCPVLTPTEFLAAKQSSE